jgi:putative FmdB family regulatory protein
MPIYEYECLKCGKTSEVLQRFSDPPLCECPECKGAVRKLISMSTFHLKGSGWYVTDYAGKNQSTSKPVESKADAGEKKAETPSAPACGSTSD